MLNFEPEGSMRQLAQRYTESQKTQPEEEVEAEEETAQPEEEVVESEELVEETETEEESEEEEEEQEEAEETIQIKYNGELLDVPKSEAIDLAQKGYDYSKKMNEMTEKVKTEAKKLADENTANLNKSRQDLIEATELMETFFNNPVATPEKLAQLLDDGDYEGHTRLKDQEDQRKELMRQVVGQRDKAKQEAQVQQKKQLDELAQQQAEIIISKMPELKEAEGQAKLEKFLLKSGYTTEEIGSFIYKAENIFIAEKARKYDELMAKGVKPKPKSKQQNITRKSGQRVAKKSASSQKVKDLTGRAKKTGNLRDAAKLHRALFSPK